MLHVLLWCNEHLARGQSAQRRQRLLPRQLRHVVFLTQMRQHKRSRAAFHQIRCKHGAVRIGQVPARSGNAHLERIRVRTGLQHIRIVVALQHDHFAAAHKLGRIARHKAKVGRKAEPAAAVLEYVARALGCVMRRRKRHNVHIPDPEALTAVEYVQTVGVLRILFLESLGCAASGKHRRLRQYITNNTNVKVTAVSTGGSKANLQSVQDGDFQLGFVQSDVMAYAWDGVRAFEQDGATHDFRTLGGLYAETVQLFTMDPDIKTVEDLKGKSVSIGAANSGVYFNALDVLNAGGITLDDIHPQYLSFEDSKESLKDGKIDAAFIVAGAPTTAITELATTNGVYMINIDGAIRDSILSDCPYYTSYQIPAGTYPGQDEPVETITVKATIVVSESLDEDTVYDMTAAIFDHADEISAENAKGAELSLENATSGMTIPFHKGAARYYAEHGITVDTKGE